MADHVHESPAKCWGDPDCPTYSSRVGVGQPLSTDPNFQRQDCDGGSVGGFFPTACGRDYVHAPHPLGQPPATVNAPNPPQGGAS